MSRVRFTVLPTGVVLAAVLDYHLPGTRDGWQLVDLARIDDARWVLKWERAIPEADREAEPE